MHSHGARDDGALAGSPVLCRSRPMSHDNMLVHAAVGLRSNDRGSSHELSPLAGGVASLRSCIRLIS